MSLAKTSLWTAGSTLIKIGAGLLVVKVLALAYGPEGFGQAGNFRQLITVLGVLAGAGIFNGVTKYVAQYEQQPAELRQVLGASSALVMLFSTLLALIFLLAARPISIALFGHAEYQQVIRFVAFLQLGIAYGNLFLAILKGFRDARGNALGIIAGTFLGVLGYLLCMRLGGYSGALVGLAVVPAMVLLPGGLLLKRRHGIAWTDFRFCWRTDLVRQLGKFTLMAIITSVTLPLAYIMMRNLLAAYYGWEEVGIWGGVTAISDAYLQFITASFTVYLLPTLARLQHKQQISAELIRTLRFVLPLVATVSLLVWLLRDLAIWLLFSTRFSGMRDLFAWQLAGDVLKVGAYVFGYLVIAKAALHFYVLAEVTQFSLLLFFSHWLIPRYGALGATQAYLSTYIIYFLLCCLLFIVYRRRV